MPQSQWQRKWLDYYDVLGLSFGCAHDQVKEAYNVKAQVTHPDMHATKSEKVREEATRQFMRVNEAYECLNNRESRREYDREWLTRNLQHHVWLEPPEVDLGAHTKSEQVRAQCTIISDLPVPSDLGIQVNILPNPPLNEDHILQLDVVRQSETTLFPLRMDFVLGLRGIPAGDIRTYLEVVVSIA